MVFYYFYEVHHIPRSCLQEYICKVYKKMISKVLYYIYYFIQWKPQPSKLRIWMDYLS